MIELTLEQQKSLVRGEETPPRVLDPVSHTKYVLLREDIYDRMSHLVGADEDGFAADLMPHVMEVFGRDGWDDPAMDVYNELDPRADP